MTRDRDRRTTAPPSGRALARPGAPAPTPPEHRIAGKRPLTACYVRLPAFLGRLAGRCLVERIGTLPVSVRRRVSARHLDGPDAPEASGDCGVLGSVLPLQVGSLHAAARLTTCCTPWRVHVRPVRVRWPAALSAAATLAHDWPADRCDRMVSSACCP